MYHFPDIIEQRRAREYGSLVKSAVEEAMVMPLPKDTGELLPYQIKIQKRMALLRPNY